MMLLSLKQWHEFSGDADGAPAARSMSDGHKPALVARRPSTAASTAAAKPFIDCFQMLWGPAMANAERLTTTRI